MSVDIITVKVPYRVLPAMLAVLSPAARIDIQLKLRSLLLKKTLLTEI